MGYEFPVFMKICYVGDAKSIHLQRWIKWITNAGHDVHLITDYPIEINNVKIYSLKHKKDGGYINFISKMRQTKKLVNKINPDILHAHYAFGFGTFGAYTNFHPYVLTAWGSDILVDTSSIYKKFAVKYALKRADLITCDAQHLKDRMKDLGAEDKKINIIYFGTDSTKFSPQKKNEALRKKLELGNSPVVISLRMLKPIYNLESLVSAIPLVLKQISQAKFIIAGEGPEEKMLKEMASSLKVNDNIRFVGSIQNDELPYYLTTSDVYVSTSLSDAGLAASTAEAMACELPVISTDFGANAEWVKDGENGFLVPTKDPTLLAEKIIVLLKDRDLRLKFGKKGRKVITERLDYNREMSKMEKIYEELI
jgi:glycosyltransferase involved in cell wall biosynthesis